MCKSVLPFGYVLVLSLFFVFTGNVRGQTDLPLNINQLLDEGRITADHTNFDIGNLERVFDDDGSSLARTPSINPLVITLTFDNPITITASSIIKSYGNGDWVLETADSQSDLDGETGTYQQLFDRTITTPVPDVYLGLTDSISFAPITTTIIRLTVVKTTGDDYVHLNNWTLTAQLEVNDLAIQKKNILPSGNEFETIANLNVLEASWTELFVEIQATSGNYRIPANALDWTITDPPIGTIPTIHNTTILQALSVGNTTVTGQFMNESASFDLTVSAPVLPVTYEQVPGDLSEADPCAIQDMPVVIIRYMPTQDGQNLDNDLTGWNMTLSDLRDRIHTLDERVAFMLTEGSKFRGYQNPDAVPFLGYRIVDIINVYEPLPKGKPTGNQLNTHFPDYYQIVDRFNGEYYVNELGVKEFWLWGWHNDDIAPAESNMSSPTTGDVSNSFRFQDDLPVYDHTYILYNYNFTRSQAEAVHNHGHQLEAMFSHVNWLQDQNTDLFWKKFVGQNSNGAFITGRAGWTHMPPNTTQHYDYLNSTLKASDIKDWRPDNLGATSMVNVDTWGNQPYDYPGSSDFGQRRESNWYVYWMQSMPGYGNEIPHDQGYMTNWWHFVANWDEAIEQGLGLYGEQASSGNPDLCCYDQLLLEGPAIPSGRYQVDGILEAKTFTENNAQIILTAKEEIRLTPGFHATTGSNLIAAIEPCVGKDVPGNPLRSLDHRPPPPYRPFTNCHPIHPSLERGNTDQRVKNGIFTFPNPTEGEITVRYTPDHNGYISYEVVNTMGQIVFQKQFPVREKIDIQFRVNLKGLNPGLYLTSLSAKDEVYSQKVLLK